jgi:hypothetical protein
MPVLSNQMLEVEPYELAAPNFGTASPERNEARYIFPRV